MRRRRELQVWPLNAKAEKIEVVIMAITASKCSPRVMKEGVVLQPPKISPNW